MTNTLGSKFHPSDNPNVRQTVLEKPPDGCSFGADSRPQKRQKLDASVSSTTTSNGASSSHTRRPAPRSSVSEPDIEVIEPLRATHNRSNPVPNDVIDHRASSDDLGERVPRAAEKSSPDVIRLPPRRTLHAFETHAKEYSFLNSTREKEHIRTLPLTAWCLGQHLFQHSESAPLKLSHEVAQKRIRVTWGRSPPQKFEFKLDRDVCSVMIVNDYEPLRENVVVQFTTTPGPTWKEIERKYKGFKGGGGRGKEVLTFLFSTARDRGFSVVDYQMSVTGIRKAFRGSAVEIIRPSNGAKVWDYAYRLAEMFELRESRNSKEDRSENIPDGPSALTRSVSPCSSTSVKTGPEL